MRRTVVVFALSFAVSLAGAWAAGCESAGAKPERTVPLPRWVRSVCGRLGDFNDTTDNLDSKIQKEVTDLDSGTVSAKAAKAKLLQAATGETKAADQLIAAVKQLGIPQATHGQTVATEFSGTLSDLRSVAFQQQRSYTNLTTNNQTASGRAKDIQSTIEKKITDIGDPLEGPRADQEFAAALNSESACTDLLPQFTPTTFVPGDCLDAPNPDADLEAHTKVACSESHLEEVFAVVNHPAGPTEPFPGEAAITSFADSTCGTEFKSYTGADADASSFDYAYFYPNKDTWPVGDREVVCVAGHQDGSRFKGSVKESAAR